MTLSSFYWIQFIFCYDSAFQHLKKVLEKVKLSGEKMKGILKKHYFNHKSRTYLLTKMKMVVLKQHIKICMYCCVFTNFYSLAATCLYL